MTTTPESSSLPHDIEARIFADLETAILRAAHCVRIANNDANRAYRNGLIDAYAIVTNRDPDEVSEEFYERYLQSRS